MRWPSFTSENSYDVTVLFAWFPKRVASLEGKQITVWLEDYYRKPNPAYDRERPYTMKLDSIPKFKFYTKECKALETLEQIGGRQ